MKKLNLPEKEICEKYLSGINSVELAKEYNCSMTSILNEIRKNNIKIRFSPAPPIINLPEKEICEKYINGINSVELAKEYNCSSSTIINRLHKNNIKIKSLTMNLPEKEICEKYISGISSIKLAKEYNCSSQTIINKLYKNNIKIRSFPHVHITKLSEKEICEKYKNGITSVELAKEYNCHYTIILNKLRDNNIKIRTVGRIPINLPMKKICEEYKNKMGLVELAEKYNCSIVTIIKNLRNNNIKIRSNSEVHTGKKVTEISKQHMSATRQGISYDEWEDFASNSSYCPLFNNDCRESNREKYDRRCFLTGLSEKENISSTGKQYKLSVHHVDMDKMQGCNGKRWKLIPVCLKWHFKIHNKLWEARIIWLLNNVW